MTRKNGKRLVIDANIARSAGTTEVPSSSYSRICLNAVLDADYIAVFNKALRQEWRKHASLHATRWRVSMVARRRIEDKEGAEFAHHLDRVCACLERTSSKDALRKDFHLIQSALATEQLILSNEKEFPRFVASACNAVKVLLQLHYANPAVEGDACILWIKAGAEKVADRRIDVWVEDHLKSE
jgi:hypothetical protein